MTTATDKAIPFVNVCGVELFEFGGTADEFAPCSGCSWWGPLDEEAPQWVRDWHAKEYAE